ncbi:MAG TPA: UDP-N-acetylmuramate--L-alanine ligase [Streptosporangiaceae bacterium]|nr:UDP-N-acetylmuramate--L-alanine ligase [Streptosporangiaceae bacterium]
MGLVTPVPAVPVEELGRVHFVGIGGAGMSGIARILLARGVAVSGSDRAGSPQLDELAGLGATVYVGHAQEHVAGVDTVITTPSAIGDRNVEIVAARRLGIPVLPRAAALGSIMSGKRGIAVSGTHGKTTISSMLTTVLRHAGADPSYVIGGILAETGLGADEGGGEWFVAEADESDGSFLMLSPEAAVVTYIEAEHLDNYKDLAEIEATFAAFAGKIREGGLLVAGRDDPGAAALAAAAASLPLRVRTYGESPEADYRVTGVSVTGMTTRLTVTAPGADPRGLTVRVPGRHYALNATAAFATAVELGVPPRTVIEGLEAYRGAQRRMEPKGEADGVRVLDSYAHHPTELAADLTAARDVAGGGRVIAVFQPHLYSRTRFFAAQFGAALGLADEALVLDIYAAREDPEPGVTGKLVADAVPGGRGRFLPDAATVPEVIAGLAKPGDLVLTMGAGDVTAIGPLIVAALHARAGE